MITVTINGSYATLVLQDSTLINDRMLKAAAVGMDSGLKIVGQISQDEFLNGPRPQRLGMVTGRLRRSIAVKAGIENGRVTGSLDTNVPYGEFHEKGFHGTIVIRRHARKGLLTVGFVREHRRRVDYAGKPFLAPAIAKGEPIILEEIKKVLAAL